MPYCQTCGEPVFGSRACTCGGSAGSASQVGLNEGGNTSHEYVSSSLIGAGGTAAPTTSTGARTDIDASLSRMLGDNDGPTVTTFSHTHFGGIGSAKSGVDCARCGGDISGNAVEYEGSKFHQACFTCIECGDVIAGDFIDRNGQPLCKPCKAKQQAHFDGKRADYIETKRLQQFGGASLGGGSSFGEGLLASEPCAICGDPMNEQVGLRSPAGVVHAACFACTSCRVPFDGSAFVERNGDPYHKACADELFADRCKQCNAAISGQFVNLDGAKYHPACFKCARCGSAISGPFAMNADGSPVCAKC